MTEHELAIVVKDVSKTFKIPVDKASGIKQAIVRFYKRNRGYRNFHVLNDVSFEIKKGEFFGIVGKNGSGKSTLLKLLAGIYVPDKGLIHLNGSLTPFIELGVGFNPELSARENVFLNGALLGFDRREIERMYDEIVRFAELEDFMEEKLKNFSSGMQVRLAFSIAIRAQSEILIMDEVLAVGDAEFQKKCFNMFRQLKKEGRTIILVTHDMGNVERFCDRVLILSEGKIMTITTPSKASSIYARLNINHALSDENTDNPSQDNRTGRGGIRVKKATFYNQDKKTNVFTMGDDLTLKITLDRDVEHKKTDVTCGLAIFNEDGVTVLGPNSEKSSLDPTTGEIVFRIPRLPIVSGDYAVTIALYNKDGTEDYFDLLDKWVHFSVIADHGTHGLVEIESQWSTT
jgi:ABC-2 type transport system ATP-binding protein